VTEPVFTLCPSEHSSGFDFRPPEPKVESSTLSSRTISFPWNSSINRGESAFPSAWVMSSEVGSIHRPNQNRNQNKGSELKGKGFERGWCGVSWVVGFHTELAWEMRPAPI